MIDHDATLTDLYTQYQSKIYDRCFHLVRNHEQAEDLKQETFLRVWKLAVAGTLEQVNPYGLLYTIATNASLDYLRKKYRFHLSLDHELALQQPDTHDSFAACEEQEIIEAVMARMLPSRREALAAWYEDKHSIGSQRTLAMRARNTFRHYYQLESEAVS